MLEVTVGMFQTIAFIKSDKSIFCIRKKLLALYIDILYKGFIHFS